MASDKCPRFNNCNAPLCPLDRESLEFGIWYPDEEICQNRNFSKLRWIRNQKKILKVNAPKDRYFSFTMLKRKCVIGKKMQGLDPDEPEGPQLERWLKQHPERKPLSEKQKQVIAKLKTSLKTSIRRGFKGQKPQSNDVLQT